MKLYYAPGACSLLPHIVSRELGLTPELIKVDVAANKAGGKDFWQINPKGYVPALELDNGEVMTEANVIAQFLADQKPEGRLVPAAGTMDRYRCQQWLSYIATELHKGFSPLWNPKAGEETRQLAIANLAKRFDYVDRELAKREFLMGQFTIADAYLFTILNWTAYHKIDMGKWPSLIAFQDRMRKRPAVAEALRAEGLLH